MSAKPRTIIHFTSSADALKGILSIGFKIKYCQERIVFGDTEKQIRVPVVSFCDIPISQAEENMAKYGRYALGLTEQWAIEKSLTPVIYLQRYSSLAKFSPVAERLGGELVSADADRVTVGLDPTNTASQRTADVSASAPVRRGHSICWWKSRRFWRWAARCGEPFPQAA